MPELSQNGHVKRSLVNRLLGRQNIIGRSEPYGRHEQSGRFQRSKHLIRTRAMPFINQKIPDADKARIDWTRFRLDRWDTTGLRHAYFWTIDRDRDEWQKAPPGRATHLTKSSFGVATSLWMPILSASAARGPIAESREQALSFLKRTLHRPTR